MVFEAKRDIFIPLRSSKWFMRQPHNLREALINRATVTNLHKGQWLYSEGEEAGGLWSVLSGSVRLDMALGPERTVLLTIVGPGNVLGQAKSFGGGPQLLTVKAYEDSCLLLISEDALHALADEYPILWQSMNDLFYRQLERRSHMVAEALCLPPKARVASRILYIASQRPPECCFAKISQSDLAEMTGVTRISVSRHLLALQSAGIVELNYRGIQIIDPRRLNAIVEEYLR